MSKNKAKQSKVKATAQVVATAQSIVEKHFGKPSAEVRKAIAEFGLKNKVALVCLYHAICAIFGLQRGTAISRLNMYTNALELKSGTGYIAGTVKDKAGKLQLGQSDHYGQQRYYGWLYGEKSAVNNDNWVHNLRNLASHEYAQKLGSEVAKDSVFTKSGNFKPIAGETLSKAILAIAEAQ